jgi:uncharacterized OsmC-like protein
MYSGRDDGLADAMRLRTPNPGCARDAGAPVRRGSSRKHPEDSMTTHRQFVLARQEPLRERYRTNSEDAWITDRARTIAGAALDPFHAAVLAGESREVPWRIGIHRALGGFHDLPNPGDVLCAALASCLGTTVRLMAARLDIPIQEFEVRVTGNLDVRGTLDVDQRTPVGFQRMSCQLRWRPDARVTPEQTRRLTAAAERASIVLQTLRHGVPVSFEPGDDSDSDSAEPGADDSPIPS